MCAALWFTGPGHSTHLPTLPSRHALPRGVDAFGAGCGCARERGPTCAPLQAAFIQGLCYAVYMYCDARERRAYLASLAKAARSEGDTGRRVAHARADALTGHAPSGSAADRTPASLQHFAGQQHDALPSYSSKVKRIRVSTWVEHLGTGVPPPLLSSALSLLTAQCSVTTVPTLLLCRATLG